MEPKPPSLAIGVTYDNRHQLKNACQAAAIANTFEFTTLRSDSRRYTVKCKAEGCPWYLHAYSVDSRGQFRITKSNQTHNCFGLDHRGHAQATEEFIATKFEEKLKEKPSYSVADIVSDVSRELGIQITYSKAYRAKERALKQINGSYEDSYTKLRKYCEDIKNTNPGSVATLEVTPENRFRRMFLCFSASAKGLPSCRCILGLSATPLKHKYQGILLAANAVDANGSLFPVAHAVVDEENDDNWLWFLQILHRDVIEPHAPDFIESGTDTLVLLSDHQKSLLDGVEHVFPDHPHAHCLQHLEESFCKQFAHAELKPLLAKAARATLKAEFDQALAAMNALDPRAVPWLLSYAKPEHWAELYFPGRRYGHLTSSVAEPLNSWLLEACEMPIHVMFERIRHQLMEWYAERRQSEGETQGTLVSKAAANIQTLVSDRARGYRVIKCTDHFYEVQFTQTLQEYLVNLLDHSCSCRAWQSLGYPCGHAIAVILARREDPQTYAKSFFTLDAYKQTYEHPIIPPQYRDFSQPLEYHEDTDSNVDADGESNPPSDPNKVMPPIARRPPGRPKKRRIRGQPDIGRNGLPKRTQRCTQCKNVGHSRRTCMENE
jgi:hypothetical protein